MGETTVKSWMLTSAVVLYSLSVTFRGTTAIRKDGSLLGIQRTVISRMAMPGGDANYKLWIHNKNYLTKEKLYKFHVDCSSNGLHVVQLDPKLVQLEVRNCTFEDEFITLNMTTTREGYPGAHMNFTVLEVKIEPYAVLDNRFCFVKGLRNKFYAGLYTVQNATVLDSIGHSLADKEDPMVPYYGEKIDMKLVYRIHHFDKSPNLLHCIESILAGNSAEEILDDCEFQCESTMMKAKSKQKASSKGKNRDEL